MAMKLLISEVLQIAHNAKTKAEKIKILQVNNSQALRSLFIWNYDDSVISVIPEGEVPYTPNEAPIGTEHTRLELEARKLYYFVKGGADNLSRMQRENMFIQLLERLHAEEAELICLTKDKKLKDKYKLTKDTIAEAYPDIHWGGRS